MDIFKFEDYGEALHEYIRQRKWGSQSRLAQAAGCQRSYISQVMKGNATLTQDQGIGICEYLGLNPDEIRYFLLLVSQARASTRKLKEFYRGNLQSMRDEKNDLARRFASAAISDSEKREIYYSSWEMMAVHILAGIPQFHTVSAISERLSLGRERTEQVLHDLANIGLVEEFKRGNWRNTTTRLHLPKESALTGTNHMNWRQRAVQDACARGGDSLHYTAVMSIARRHIPVIKSLLLEAIDKSREVIKTTDKEEAICMCCDLFEV